MRGIYIALITYVFVELCRHLVLALPDLTGGSNGLPGVPSVTIGGHNFASYDGLGYLWLLGAAVAVLVIVLNAIRASPFGQSLIALRDNEPLAVSRGVNRVRQHLIAFAISGAVAGFTGAIYVSYFRVADVTLFNFGFVTLGLSMIFLGGTQHTWGPVLGAIVVSVVSQELNDYVEWRQIIIALSTIAILILAPHGISGALVTATLWLRRRLGLDRTAPRAAYEPSTLKEAP
jgi:branched-chain amino acid transport system permease protein